MLTAGEIAKLVAAGEVAWPGELRGNALLLRLGGSLQLLVEALAADTIDLSDQDSINRLYQPPWPQWDRFDLQPGQMVLCQVDQPLRLGSGHAGAIGTLSHLARVGLATHVASPWVLPGWNGHLTLELVNVGPAALRIYHGMPVARLVLFKMDGIATVADVHPFYGTGNHLGSRYADEYPVNEYPR